MHEINHIDNFYDGKMLLIDKPKNWTSFDVVNKVRGSIRHNYKKIKVGHSGTLDPLATGLLILCTGKKTKTLHELQGLDKTYKATFCVGATTPSFDLETEIDKTFTIDALTENQIIETAKSFIGQQEQLPPQYSAIKKDGIAAYKLARAGKKVELKTRPITIYDFQIISIDLPYIHAIISCSKGTYIRSLAHDFGMRLNNGAYLYDLRRLSIGQYQIKDAWQLDDLIDRIKELK